jgi:hypothetical protein
MDPNETLKRMRRLLEQRYIAEDSDHDNTWLDPESADEFAEMFEILDGWISNGGFLPKGWTK